MKQVRMSDITHAKIKRMARSHGMLFGTVLDKIVADAKDTISGFSATEVEEVSDKPRLTLGIWNACVANKKGMTYKEKWFKIQEIEREYYIPANLNMIIADKKKELQETIKGEKEKLDKIGRDPNGGSFGM